jgi:N-acetylglutamate synthase-like GNAT family acetyltransferase
MIRRWKKNDIPKVTQLLNQLEVDLLDSSIIFEVDVKSHFMKMKNHEVYESYVYEEEGEIKGFISLIFYRTVFHKNGTALINELVINNDYRNKGIGKKLIEYVITEARKREMDEIEVGVMKENGDAIRFYKNNGIDDEYLLLGKEFLK